jgi:hypothetical protein
VASHLWRFCCRFASHAATLDLPLQQPQAGWASKYHGTPAPTYVGRHGAASSATAARTHCWRRHQQYPSATAPKSRPNANPTLGVATCNAHTPPGFGDIEPRTATRQVRVAEARLPYWSALPRNEALAQLQNSQLSERKPGFTEQIAA